MQVPRQVILLQASILESSNNQSVTLHDEKSSLQAAVGKRSDTPFEKDSSRADCGNSIEPCDPAMHARRARLEWAANMVEW